MSSKSLSRSLSRSRISSTSRLRQTPKRTPSAKRTVSSFPFFLQFEPLLFGRRLKKRSGYQDQPHQLPLIQFFTSLNSLNQRLPFGRGYIFTSYIYRFIKISCFFEFIGERTANHTNPRIKCANTCTKRKNVSSGRNTAI